MSKESKPKLDFRDKEFLRTVILKKNICDVFLQRIDHSTVLNLVLNSNANCFIQKRIPFERTFFIGVLVKSGEKRST
ncbi:hypothetical protein [Sphingobacterium sp. UME9]|uniref:hypothetical protein n=1 Tax=Sphingobacterium sp. UME9 TaxID=1862316 RepID=UPI0016049BF2|nr:hypothetical protein [Sphingobacterium sp. UME9]MBB1643634.1 hypothetical protein [Sphingobacterium sp. UME9]